MTEKPITVEDAAKEAADHTHYEDSDEMPDSVKWAHESVMLHQDNTNSLDEEAVSDLLADLMHLCDHRGLDFSDELHRAQDNYSYERSRQGPDRE